MKFSVLIPTYRRPNLLHDNILALLPQLAACDAEAVVIDNDPEGSAGEAIHGCGDPRLRYVHEPRRGVVNARNRGVTEARGDHLIFIDDDEVPAPRWLAAHARLAAQGAQAAFGKVVPLYREAPLPGLQAFLDDLYTRDLNRPTGTDITTEWAHVGTGNSMFARAVLPSLAPFDTRFNASGGEDVWLVKMLIAGGARLIWNAEAVVQEQVLPDRASLEYVSARKFRHGQQRVIFVRGRGGLGGNLRAAVWMGAGALQVTGYGAQMLARRALRNPAYRESAARIHAGLGKLLWWRESKDTPYA